jgi:nicotinamidase-related amidase
MAEQKDIPYTLEIKKTAVVVVDMQNDFVRVGAPMSLQSCRDAIPNAQRVLEACRKVKMPVIYLKFITGPQETLVWTWSPQEYPPEKCCWKHHKRYYEDIGKEAEASDIIEELYPEPKDYIVEKYGYNGFYNTNLEAILQANHIEYLVVFGALTPICVDDTIAGAFERQFKVLAVSDAMGTFDAEFHKNSLRMINMKYGRVLTTEEFLQELAEAKG